MDVEVTGEYGLARTLKAESLSTPCLIKTLPVPEQGATVSFADPPVPWDSIHVDSAEDKKETYKSPLVKLLGAEGTYSSQTRMPETIADIRSRLRPDQMLFAPMLALPHRYALYTLMGIDMFDTAPIVEASREEKLLTQEGWLESAMVKEKLQEGKLLEHNTRIAQRELALVRQCIQDKSIRILAEARAAWDPWASSALRMMDARHKDVVEPSIPVCGGRLPTPLPHAMQWPEIQRYRERLQERYVRPEMADVLLLLPCTATKPYSFSRGHRTIRSLIRDSQAESRIHEVIVTSPLGLVPRELETYHPCMQYDTSVTGQWTTEEKENVAILLTSLQENAYKHVIAHLAEEHLDVVGTKETTFHRRIDSPESLRALHDALSTLERDSRWKERLRQDMASRLRFQFGPEAECIAEDAEIKGRYPNMKILAKGEQKGMLTAQRGMISLTMQGARILCEKNIHVVEIGDFIPRGDIFAVGVESADPEIRIGDDVVVAHKGEARAVGVANMSPRTMTETRRGVAVRTRAHL